MINVLKNIDYATLILYFLLATLGIVSIYSSAYNPEYPSIFSPNTSYGRQIIWGGLSLVMGLIILLLEPDFIKKAAMPFYIFCMTLLLLVLIVGQERGGAKAWFGVGSFGIQPAEFSKIAVSLMIANYLSDINVQIRKRNTQINLLVITMLPIIFILLQPDLGTVLVFSAFILVLYREGVIGNVLLVGLLYAALATTSLLLIQTSYTMWEGFDIPAMYILMFVVFLIACFSVFVTIKFFYKRYRRKILIRIITISSIALLVIPSFTMLFNALPDNYQKKRIEIVLGLREDPDGIGYNINQALSAIGSGELTGKGYREATLANSQFKLVPEQSTDFIFCTFGEEWGFLGGLVLFTLFVFLIFRLIIIAERQRTNFARVYIYSVACILFLHFTINIGMVIGVAPIIGIPLPFFSYGGSSLLAFSIMIFIALKLDADRLDVY